MAFDFPDPITTPEFTAPNGFTYVYDQGQGLWKLATKTMKVIQTTGSISMGDKLPFKTTDTTLRMKSEKKDPNDPFYDVKPEAGFRWMGQNPETRRIIYYTDRWFGYTDDEGVTWKPTDKVMSMYKPGSGESSNSVSIDRANRDQSNPFIWCGGKQWLVKTQNFGGILVTFDDFETIYQTKFYASFEDHGFDSDPWLSLKYDRINNEIWSTWGKGKIVQFDVDLSKWLNPQLTNGGPTSLLKYTDGPDKGVLFKKQIYLRHGYWSGHTSDFGFNDIALSGHGTKIATNNWGQLVRSTDGFQTWQEINSALTYNDPYYARSVASNTKDIVPGQGFNYSRIQYIEETGVWLLVGRNSFQASFDDGITWVKMDYKTRGTKEDTILKPTVAGDYTSNSATPSEYRYYYYLPVGSNWNAGYLKGYYYYITQEVGDPKRNQPEYHTKGTLAADQQEIINSWCLENVMYVTEDFKNWTRIPYGIDWGSENSNYDSHTPGAETAFIWHSPGADRIFILSDGHYKQTPYYVNYIDGFK